MNFNKDLSNLVSQHLEEIIVITDKHRKVVWVNEWFTKLTKYTPEEVIGKKLGPILQGKETDQATVDKMKKSLAKEEKFNVNIVNYNKEGRKYWLNINCTPIFNDYDELEYFIAIERDITTEYEENQERLNILLKELDDVVKQKSKLIEFNQMLAHDLKNPLYAISCFLEYMDIPDQELSDLLFSELDRVKKLIEKILSSNNHYANELTLTREKVKLIDLFDRMIRINKYIIEDKRLTINLKGKEDFIIISDKILLHQIIENLFINALKYSLPATTVEIKLRYDIDMLSIEISNVTETLADWQIEKIFDPFQKFGISHDDCSHGMGTYLVKKYVSLLNGKISVFQKDHRIFFKVLLPVKQNESIGNVLVKLA